MDKIIFICQQVSPDANRAQYNRTKFLCENYDLSIIANGSVSSVASEKAKAVHIFPFKKKMPRLLFPFWVLGKIIQLKKNEHIGLVYSSYESRSIIIAFWVKKIFKMSWILDLWDDPEKALMLAKQKSDFLNKLNQLLKYIEFIITKPCLKCADKIIIGLIPEGIIKKYSLNHNEILSVTNGINLNYNFEAHLKNKNTKHRLFSIFYCGAVDRVRLEGLKQCLEIVFEKISRLRITIIGPEERGGYQWLTEELKAFEGRLILDIQGKQPYDNVVAAIDRADVCICPYPAKLDIAATYPVKIFDYMIMGKPIVASRLPGVRKVLSHKVDSLLFKPGRYDSMAECIIKLHDSEMLRKQLSKGAKENVLKYEWESIHNEINDFIQGLFRFNSKMQTGG